jgi:hypothetical protein
VESTVSFGVLALDRPLAPYEVEKQSQEQAATFSEEGTAL